MTLVELPPGTHPTAVQLVEELAADYADELGTEEQVMLRWIGQTASRIGEIKDQLAREGLTVQGSRKQPRPHPLVETESKLRRELRDAFDTWRNHAQVAQMNASLRGNRLIQ